MHACACLLLEQIIGSVSLNYCKDDAMLVFA